MEQQLLAISGLFVTAWMAVVLIYNMVKRNYLVASWRNLFLIGFAFFQGFGAFYEVLTGYGYRWYVPQPSAFMTMAMLSPLFMGLTFLFAMMGYRWRFPQAVLPKLELPLTTPMFIASNTVLLGLALGAAIVVPQGYLSGFFTVFKSGFGAAAVALATHFLLARKFNPAGWVLFLVTLVVATVASTVGESGRRGLLSVFMAGGWMWYFHSLRFRTVPGIMLKLGLAGAAAFVFMGAYNTTRGESGRESIATFFSRASQISGLVSRGVVHSRELEGMVYSDTSLNTLFIIDNYPDPYPYVTGNGAGLFFGMPIPREIWPDKPEGLGLILKSQMNVPANLGTGIVGHGWAEGAYFGVVCYAVFFGLLVGAMDRAIAERSWNPYFVAATGASLGNVFGLARGETSIFLALIVAGFIGTWVALSMTNLFLGKVLGAIPMPVPALGENAPPGRWAPGAAVSDEEETPSLVDPGLAAAYSAESQASESPY